MRVRWIVLALALALPACGDEEPPVPRVEPAPEMSEYEKVIASRPRPMGMARQNDNGTGFSMAFPQVWEVERGGTALFRARAPQGTAPYTENISVHVIESSATLDAHLADVRRRAAQQNDFQEVMSGGRRLNGRDARTFRYTLPWKRGRTASEVTVLREGGRIYEITGTCHVDDRPAFATTLTIILQSIRWRPQPPNK